MNLDTWIWIVIVIFALLAGVALGFFIARRYMMKYLQDNPPINEEMLRIMMMQMGQKPSQKKINQMMTQMNKASTKPEKKVKAAKK
ncbi:YneF family protein [Planococcus beigongshangi]|uniref:YneF family protein n=1 Tax=Planococcus beigongshangi TaxID=2782536 RepID=UPI003D7B1905